MHYIKSIKNKCKAEWDVIKSNNVQQIEIKHSISPEILNQTFESIFILLKEPWFSGPNLYPVLVPKRLIKSFKRVTTTMVKLLLDTSVRFILW